MIRKIRRSGPSIDLSKGGKSQRNWGAVSIGRGGGGGGGRGGVLREYCFINRVDNVS